MGLTDKIKLGVKNVNSKLGEEADLIGLNGKISDEKKKIDGYYKEMGEYYYIHRDNLTDDNKAILKSICDKIDKSLKNISDIENNIQEIKDKGHNEREENRKTYQ